MELQTVPYKPARVPPRPPLWRRVVPSWRTWRRLTQLAFLALFLVLFRLTDYRGADELSEPVNFFFLVDPLVAAAAMLGAKQLIGILWPAVVTLLLTVVLARFFCGWVCPLGTLLDLFSRVTRPVGRLANKLVPDHLARLRPVRHVLLLAVLAAAPVGFPLVGYLDPFAILTRGLALVADPALHSGANAAYDASAAHPGWWTPAANRVYPVFRDHVLPFQRKVYLLAGVSLAILATVFALEWVARRFWCRYLCPLGAMLGLVARLSPLHRLPGRNCGKCPAAEDCGTSCRMGAFENDHKLSPEACNLCMDCVSGCPHTIAHFTFCKTKTPAPPVDLSRRVALGTIAAAVAAPVLVRAGRIGRSPSPDPSLLRPPGVSDEAGFLNQCVRCGECLKVCPTNALQPAGLIAGIDGIFSPYLVPRTGYCEVNCTLCSQVCPTNAIPRLTQESKSKTVIGKAVFDLDRCLPWAKDEECICCEEHCPVVPDKAIQYDDVEVTKDDGTTVKLQQPYVVWDRCIGCGICVNKCPIDGQAAIHVRRTEAVPKGEGPGRTSTRGQGQATTPHDPREPDGLPY